MRARAERQGGRSDLDATRGAAGVGVAGGAMHRCWRAAPEGAVGPFRRAGGGDTLERLPAVDRSADTAQQ